MLEFEAGDKVLLKISLKKGVIKFEIRRKLSPRYIRPLEILERVGEVTYRLTLLPSLEGIHNVFYDLQL